VNGVIAGLMNLIELTRIENQSASESKESGKASNSIAGQRRIRVDRGVHTSSMDPDQKSVQFRYEVEIVWGGDERVHDGVNILCIEMDNFAEITCEQRRKKHASQNYQAKQIQTIKEGYSSTISSLRTQIPYKTCMNN
jgi:hypothetical protein